jgi:hypothetical protein
MIKKSENLIAKSKPKNQKNTPPSEVINAIKKDITNRFNINQNKIEVKESHQKTWFDGCLELAKPDEFCTQALVEGWRIILQNNDKTWIYRTNNNGSIIRLE